MKKCNHCEEQKSLEQFSKNKKAKDGLQGKCKDCMNKLYKKDYYSNREKHLEKNRKVRTETNYYEKRYDKKRDYYKQINKAYHQSKTLPYWIVYILPIPHYAGVTNNPYYRMAEHTSRHKRDITGWYEVAQYDNQDDALAHEARLHAQGYDGEHPRKKYKPKQRQHKVK